MSVKIIYVLLLLINYQWMEQSDHKMIWYNQLIDLGYKLVVAQFAFQEHQNNGRMKELRYQVQVPYHLQSYNSLLVCIFFPKKKKKPNTIIQ